MPQVPEAPKEAMVFMEDLPENEQDMTGLGKYGAGKLYNASLPSLFLWHPSSAGISQYFSLLLLG